MNAVLAPVALLPVAGAIGCRPAAPARVRVDARARDRGTLFTRAHAQSAWTLPSRLPASRAAPRDEAATQTLRALGSVE
jgi:hypothetical protein